MKKFVIILLSVLLTVSLITSCSGNTDVDGEKDNPTLDTENSETPEDPIEEEPEDPTLYVVAPTKVDLLPEGTAPEKVLKYTVTSNGDSTLKTFIMTVDTFNVPAGSTLEYDVYLEDDVRGLGNFEIRYNDGTMLSQDNESSVRDAAFMTTSVVDDDITDYALGNWYRRVIPLYGADSDSREINGIRVGSCDLTNGCEYVAYFDNICIKDASGNVIKEFTNEELAALEIKEISGVNSKFEVVDDPNPRMPRKTADMFHFAAKEPAGNVADGSYVDVTLDMGNLAEFNGIYFGAENASNVEVLNSYIVAKDRSVLKLYHLSDKIELVSPISVVNLIDGLVLRFAHEGENLNVYVCEKIEGVEPKLLWSVPAAVEAGSEFGVIRGKGIGSVIAAKGWSFADGIVDESLVPFDSKTMLETYINCSTDKTPLEYVIGENMIFEISSYFKENIISFPFVKLMVEGDDGSSSELVTDFSAGTIKVITRSDVSGFEYVEAKALTGRRQEVGSTRTLTSGAGAGLDSFEPIKDTPADFDEFWKGKMDELFTIDPVLLEFEDHSNKGYYIYYVKIDAGKYGPVTGKLTYSKKAKPGSLKLKLAFMGYGVGDIPYATDSKYIYFAVSAHSIDMGQPESYYNQLASNELKNYGFDNVENSDRETVYFLQMLMRDVQAVRYGMTLDVWNGKDVELEGGSQGGFQSITVGALMNEYVTSIYSAGPAFCDWAGMTAGRLPSTFPFPDYHDPLAYYDSINFAHMVKCPVTMLAGLGDTICRPAGIYGLYDAIPTPKNIIWVQNMPHGPYYDYCLKYTYSDN